jgi:hypothetical protein
VQAPWLGWACTFAAGTLHAGIDNNALHGLIDQALYTKSQRISRHRIGHTGAKLRPYHYCTTLTHVIGLAPIIDVGPAIRCHATLQRASPSQHDMRASPWHVLKRASPSQRGRFASRQRWRHLHGVHDTRLAWCGANRASNAVHGPASPLVPSEHATVRTFTPQCAPSSAGSVGQA